jgi:hypothetical protein
VYGVQSHFETLVKHKDDLANEYCPKCESASLQLELSLFGGYSIKGPNGASQRPKHAGSFKRTKS